MGALTMIAIAVALFLTLKTITLIEYARSEKPGLTTGDLLLWFLAWPGLHTREFFSKIPAGTPSDGQAGWLAAAAKTAFGLALAFWAAPALIPDHPLIGGWIGMFGIVFTLHFGGFHLLALAWRRAGRNVRPIMNAPICSQSLSEFWSQRWNLAFRDFASLFLLRPLSKLCDVRAAAFGCFVFSGLIHDLAISVPAGAGYGLPTAYFLIQGIGAAFERSSLGTRLGLRRGLRGRAFTLCCTALPAFWLFHPAFVLNVIVPLLG